MKYSIITVNYNNRDGLRKTIESVIHQSCKDFEYFIIDGGSTDGSVDVIKEYDAQINYWVSEPDGGIYQGMNKGIRKAQGEYLNFMNSGDCFYDDDVLKNAMPYLTADIVHGRLFDRSRNSFPYLIDREPTMMYLYESSLQHQSCFIRRSLFDKELYDEHYKIVSDWKFFIQQVIFQNCSFALIPINIALFEGNGISISQREKDDTEREDVLSQMFPPRVLQDYQRYAGKESPMIDLIPLFNRTRGLHNFILRIVKAILKIYYLFHKKPL
jgi:glycosyltransferase involved in cell wall biosynthesis